MTLKTATCAAFSGGAGWGPGPGPLQRQYDLGTAEDPTKTPCGTPITAPLLLNFEESSEPDALTFTFDCEDCPGTEAGCDLLPEVVPCGWIQRGFS